MTVNGKFLKRLGKKNGKNSLLFHILFVCHFIYLLLFCQWNGYILFFCLLLMNNGGIRATLIGKLDFVINFPFDGLENVLFRYILEVFKWFEVFFKQKLEILNFEEIREHFFSKLVCPSSWIFKYFLRNSSFRLDSLALFSFL